MRRRGRLLLCCLVLLLLASSARGDGGTPSGGNVFLWTVRSEKGSAYLLGSIHLLKKEMYPLDRRIEEAFSGSSALAVETDIGAGEKEKLGKLILENALYPEGDTLEKHVSRETYDLVRRKLHPLGMARVDRMRPWALALTAATIEYMKMGLDPDYGIDRYFLEKADGRKKIVELETYDSVIRLLKGLPEGIQDLFLFYTLTDLDTVGGEVDAILSSWRAGDVKGMEAVVYRSRDEYPKLRPVYEILVSRRNRTMTEKIEEYLTKGETYFIVVGAAHLVGKDGILERLREKGYAVEQR
ncbi:MAG TPA: TraB/GumN family protein [Candidatus Limnocylindrales bacterium]|nr:TraB/GumN family protein [Candidatus Limnocylindrales bacterium]